MLLFTLSVVSTTGLLMVPLEGPYNISLPVEDSNLILLSPEFPQLRRHYNHNTSIIDLLFWFCLLQTRYALTFNLLNDVIEIILLFCMLYFF